MTNKGKLIAGMLMLTAASTASAYTYDIKGETYQVDTLFHAQVGPGTTQTSLLFTGPSYDMRVFYITIDLEDPNVSIRAVSGQDMVAGGETTSSMAQRHSTEGAQYFAGVNGDFFVTSGSTKNGVSMVGTPISSCIVDGEFYKTSNENFQFAVDVEGVPFIGTANYLTSTAVSGANTVLFKGVNVGSIDNGITVYTPRYYGATDSDAGCAEVTARLADGETFSPGKSCRMVITGTPSTAGNMDIPEDGFVIHGRGSNVEGGTTIGAFDFVNSLKEGDEITLNSVVLMGSESIVPQQMISGQPHALQDGVELGPVEDTSGFHPRTVIGYGDNKTKVVMMVVDGRSTISNGAMTSQLGYLMKYAGATDAINLDGGGSTTLYTQALGIRNVPSDGKERADANAIFVVSSAPTDNEIAKITFADWGLKDFPCHGIYKPVIYGYNKYGVLVDTDVEGFTLSCEASLGYIKEDGETFVANGSGLHALTATYNGLTATIPVMVLEGEGMSMRLDSVVNDTFRSYPVEVESANPYREQPVILDPASFTWSTNDGSIVDIDAETGVLKGLTDGEAMVECVMGEFSDELKVLVQKPTSHVMAIDPDMDVNTWSITQTGGRDITAEALDNGMKLTYTGASGRNPYIRLTKTVQVWSLPDAIRIRINPHDAPVSSMVLSLYDGLNNNVNYTPEITLTPNAENIIEIATKEWTDSADMASYPIKLGYINLKMGTSTSGTEYTIDIPGIEAVYNAVSSGGVSAVPAADEVRITVNGDEVSVTGSSKIVESLELYDTAGVKVSYANNESTVKAPGSGVYIVKAVLEGNMTKIQKVVVK